MCIEQDFFPDHLQRIVVVPANFIIGWDAHSAVPLAIAIAIAKVPLPWYLFAGAIESPDAAQRFILL